MNYRKYPSLLTLITSLIIFTFLWANLIWANPLLVQPPSEIKHPKSFVPETYRIDTDSLKTAQPCPQNLPQSISVTVPTDELGRPTAYKEKYGKVSSRHYDIQYNELGDVAYEKVKVSAKSGWGPFSSKTKVLTEYWYGYDEYGQHEKIKENEIYRKVSTNPIGQIIKAVVGIVTAAFTAGMGIWVTAAWMAAENFVFSILSGADFKQALLSAAISYIATIAGAAVGGYLSGGAQGVTQAFSSTFTGTLFERFTAFFQNFTVFDVLFQTLSLIDQLMVDEEGKGLFEQIFGEWGSVVLSAISIFSGFLSGNVNGQGPPSQYQIFGAIGRVIVSALVNAFKDKLGPEWAQALSAFFSQLFVTYANQETRQQESIQNLREAGFEVKTDNWGNIISVDLPQAILNYANATAENITTGGLSTVLDAAKTLSAYALQKNKESFWTRLVTADNAWEVKGVSVLTWYKSLSQSSMKEWLGNYGEGKIIIMGHGVSSRGQDWSGVGIDEKGTNFQNRFYNDDGNFKIINSLSTNNIQVTTNGRDIFIEITWNREDDNIIGSGYTDANYTARARQIREIYNIAYDIADTLSVLTGKEKGAIMHSWGTMVNNDIIKERTNLYGKESKFGFIVYMGSPLEGKYTNQLLYARLNREDSKIISEYTEKLIYIHNPHDLIIVPYAGSAGPLYYATVNISVDIQHWKMWENDFIMDRIREEINR